MSSNLPPGVTESMIPGNRPEDQELEGFSLTVEEIEILYDYLRNHTAEAQNANMDIIASNLLEQAMEMGVWCPPEEEEVPAIIKSLQAHYKLIKQCEEREKMEKETGKLDETKDGIDKPYEETGELTRICAGCRTRYPVSSKSCPNCGLRGPNVKGHVFVP